MNVGIQWLRVRASCAGDVGLIPGQGTEILHMPLGVGRREGRLTFEQRPEVGFKDTWISGKRKAQKEGICAKAPRWKTLHTFIPGAAEKLEVRRRVAGEAEKAMASTPLLLPGKSHGRRSLLGCSPWGCEESDMTERLHFHFSLSCIGEGNGNPFQCSCLENPRDGGTWWAAVHGVAQSRTRPK